MLISASGAVFALYALPILVAVLLIAGIAALDKEPFRRRGRRLRPCRMCGAEIPSNVDSCPRCGTLHPFARPWR
jgi:hypothetical protein